jgi:hypothetical protein
VLGARPQTRPAAPVQKPAVKIPDTANEPVLPLGAPRKKPATPAAPQQ